jgi:hypothetical protein
MHKPLYVVLTGYWFDEFKAGRKKVEYRINDGRFQIDKLRGCKGRQVLLQRGYTKIRLKAVIRFVRLVDGGREVAIYLRDIKPVRQSTRQPSAKMASKLS